MWPAWRARISLSSAIQRSSGSVLCSPCQRASTRGFATFKSSHSAEFELLVPAVQAFHARFGHFLVPYSFPVAADDAAWPLETRGVNIGRRLFAFMTNARHQKRFPSLLPQLQALGFPAAADYRRLLWEKRTVAALQAFYALHRHSLVPVGYVVPHQACEYPRETWGYDLGRRVAKLRDHRAKLTEHELHDLASVEFSFDVDDTHWRTKILPALHAFQSRFRHGFVKRKFVVPTGTDAWPELAWGLRLGLVVHNIRCHGAYREQLERDQQTLGDGWLHLTGTPEQQWTVVILPALKQYTIQHGHADVPATFVVPTRASWPRSTWGFSLGQLVHTARLLEIYHDQISRDKHVLRQLGANWFASLDDKWAQLVVPALAVYGEVVGRDKQMPQRFVVPSQPPWPEAAWGLKLGEMVGRMRTRNHFAAQRSRNAGRLKNLQLERVLGIAPSGSM